MESNKNISHHQNHVNQIYVKRKANPFRWIIKRMIPTYLWILLYFCFKHDYKREDFVFIPIQASWMMALIIAYDWYMIINQYLIKVDSGKICTFIQWKKYKKSLCTDLNK